MIEQFAPLAGEAVFAPAAMPWDFSPDEGHAVLAPANGANAFGALLGPSEPTYAGLRIEAFGGDFFERIHYSFKLADLGNVIGLQVLTLYVWNAFRRSERLLAIDATGADGITQGGGPGAIPFDFPALREEAFTFTVTTDGPANIAAAYAFNWQTLDDTVRIVGSRITGWSFIPDWSGGVVERLSWLTDVLTAFDASEQRRALRLAPRKAVEFDVFFTGRERRYAEAALWGWGARSWALPVWTDGIRTASALAVDDTEIVCDTATRDFAVGSLAMLIGDAFTFETVEVAEVQADRIVLLRGLTADWPAGTWLYPARTARISDRAQLPRWDGDASGARLAFDLLDPVDYTADAGAVTYRGYPVLTMRPNWVGGLSLEMQRKLAELDAMTGPRVYEDESGLPAPVQRMRFLLQTRAEVDAFRRLLYALRGRHGAAWVPTWEDDVEVVATVADTATAVEIAFMSYARQINLATGRRDLRIETRAGQVFYRRIDSVEVISSSVERLTIDAALGVTLAPADILSVSFLQLMRMDSDQIDLAHWTGETAEIATIWRGFQHGA